MTLLLFNKMIVNMIFGSHLYGTDTPDSDQDFKGVFLPDADQILLGSIPKSHNTMTKKGDGKNSAEDVDTEIYSLHHFMHLAIKGETVAFDMLHAPKDKWLEWTPLWEELVSLRSKFYSKNLNAFVGYARRQAAKYGLKGSRLSDVRRVVAAFQALPEDTRLRDVWDDLPDGDHIKRFPADPRRNGDRMYQVCGKGMIESSAVGHYMPTLQSFIDEFGKRARMAETNEGVDWKAVSHAFRAGYQMKHILVEGTYSYPLPESDFLRDVKMGKYPYKEVGPMLDALMDEAEGLTTRSNLPEKCDKSFWDNWLATTMKIELFE